MDYEDDDFYCDSDEDRCYSEEGGYAESDDETEDKLRVEKDFKILSGETIRLLQEKDILETSSLLGLSIEETTILLLTHNWKKIDLQDEWFADEEKVRKRAGLLVNPVVDVSGFNKDQFYCKICMDEFPINKSRSVACGHPFCDECWGNYIRVSIDDGPDCLLLKCPEPSCGAAVGKDMVATFLSDEEKGKYLYYLFRSYIEQNRKIKWCPAPNCDCAIEFEIGSEKIEVTCDCSCRFCWNCTEEIHSPVNCETVIKWIMKNGAESENMNWILANSKPCPKCKRPIEKNQGCMHMTCRMCKHEFCWLCLGNWNSHGNKTGGFYSCNIYTGQQQEGKIDEAERTREYAKQALDRYLHYYERWDSNQKAIIKANEELKRVRELKLDELSREHDEYQSQLRLIEAWEQIIECRRVLKWSYAYGYYLPQEDIIKKQFFECSQGEAEAALERLHHCTEKESFYLEDDDPEKCSNKMSYKDYHMKLVNLTVSAKNHFENGLEKLVAKDLL